MMLKFSCITWYRVSWCGQMDGWRHNNVFSKAMRDCTTMRLKAEVGHHDERVNIRLGTQRTHEEAFTCNVMRVGAKHTWRNVIRPLFFRESFLHATPHLFVGQPNWVRIAAPDG